METTVSMVRVQSYFPPALLEDLRQVAKNSRISLAEAIRLAVSGFVQTITRRQNRPSGAHVLLKSVEQIGFKGPKDLATSLDKYLYG